MNLIEILKNNGTGLLRGLCRPTNFSSFEELEDSDEVAFDLTFSLNEINLGTFDVSRGGVGEKSMSAEIFYGDNDHDKSKSIWLDIKWPDNSQFGIFEAILTR